MSEADETLLLVAASGGHLGELRHLAPRLVHAPARQVWVTFDTLQTSSLLAGERVELVPYTAPRDASAVVRNLWHARRLFRTHNVAAVVSTGSAVALAYLPYARVRGVPCFYIEAATRTTGPSITGRLLGCVPGVRRFTQSPTWRRRGWEYAGSVFDGFTPIPPAAPSSRPLRLVVTVGTLDYSFVRLFRRLAQVVPDDWQLTVQSGCTDLTGMRISGLPFMSSVSLAEAMADADVVIAHAGVGSALDALKAGRAPVLVPRRRAFGEHVDDHQVELAEALAARGLATAVDADALTPQLLRQAAVKRVASREPARVDIGLGDGSCSGDR